MYEHRGISIAVDKEDGRNAIPLIIHTESINNNASFFHLFASTRSWGQLRTMLRIIAEHGLQPTTTNPQESWTTQIIGSETANCPSSSMQGWSTIRHCETNY